MTTKTKEIPKHKISTSRCEYLGGSHTIEGLLKVIRKNLEEKLPKGADDAKYCDVRLQLTESRTQTDAEVLLEQKELERRRKEMERQAKLRTEHLAKQKEILAKDKRDKKLQTFLNNL